MADTQESRYPAQWVVHNALDRPNSPPGGNNKRGQHPENFVAPVKGGLLPVVGHVMASKQMNKGHISQSAPALHDDDSVTSEQMAKFAQTDALANLGVGKTKQLSLSLPRAADLVVKEMKIGARRKNSNTGESNWQVDKLSKEVHNLAHQLDDALREKEVQRIELTKLKKQLMSTSALPGASVANPTMLASQSMVQLPSIVNGASIASMGGDDLAAKDFRQLTNADVYGVPSEGDKAEMQLRPTNSGGGVGVGGGGSAAISRVNPQNPQNAYLNNPNISANKMGSGHVSAHFSLYICVCCLY